MVRANFNILEGSLSIPAGVNLIWNNWVPPKVCFFGLEVQWGKIITAEQLKKRFFLGQTDDCYVEKLRRS